MVHITEECTRARIVLVQFLACVYVHGFRSTAANARVILGSQLLHTVCFVLTIAYSPEQQV